MRVRVYKNLNNGLISIQCAKRRLVIGHCQGIHLSRVNFKVNEAGRQRVLKEKRKNVHAFAEGEIIAIEGFQQYKEREAGTFEPQICNQFPTRVSYNPYKGSDFMAEGHSVAGCSDLHVNNTVGMSAINIFKKTIDCD